MVRVRFCLTNVRSVVGGVRSCNLFVLRNRSSQSWQILSFQLAPLDSTSGRCVWSPKSGAHRCNCEEVRSWSLASLRLLSLILALSFALKSLPRTTVALSRVDIPSTPKLNITKSLNKQQQARKSSKMS